MDDDVQRLHQDLVEWGVLEPGIPVRFTRRFQAALARAAAHLQAAERNGQKTDGDALSTQVEAALTDFLEKEGKRCGPGHVRFARAVHLLGLPPAARAALGL